MGFFFGFLLANVFMCYFEEKFIRDGLMFYLYRRYVDDIFVRMFNIDVVIVFFIILNGLYFSLTFTMEFFVDDRIFFIGIEIIKNGIKFEI